MELGREVTRRVSRCPLSDHPDTWSSRSRSRVTWTCAGRWARPLSVGFEAIRVRFGLSGDVPGERLDKLKERTERYCVVLQTLLAPPPIETRCSVG